MTLRLVPPDEALLGRSAPFSRLLAEAAPPLGLRFEMDGDYGFIARLTGADGESTPVFGKSLGLNPDAAAHLAADKDYTARWLAAAGFPTPPGQLIFGPAYRDAMALKNAGVASRLPGPEAAAPAAARFGYPVILKPNSGSEGRGIRLVSNPAQLAQDLPAALADDDILRLEPQLAGRDHRILVLGGRVVLAYERRPLSVRGDGETPLRFLIDRALSRLAAEHRGAKILPDDPRLIRCLDASGLTPDSILPAGRSQPLLDNANLSTGGVLRDLTGRLSAPAEALAIRVAASLGLAVAGIDILAPDLRRGIVGATVLEVNSSPGLDYFATAAPGNWSRARAIVTDMLRLRFRQRESGAWSRPG